GFDTMLSDIPKAEVDPITGEVWVPVNLHGTMDFTVSLEYALVFSKNVPSVDIFSKVGAKAVEKWARQLGFTSPIIADKALALGASCVYMPELARAFAIFARNGRWLEPVYIRRIRGRNGELIKDNTVVYDPMLSPVDRLDRLGELGGVDARQAIPARAAFLVTKLLRSVVTDGYSGALRAIEIPVAGKTGTSSATMDLWFAAFTSRWLTTMWLGDDLRQRPLGKDDAAFMMAVPVWARYMAEASAGAPARGLPGGTRRGADAPPPQRTGAGRSSKAPRGRCPSPRTRRSRWTSSRTGWRPRIAAKKLPPGASAPKLVTFGLGAGASKDRPPPAPRAETWVYDGQA